MSAPPFLAVPWTAVSVNELNEPEASATFRAAQLPNPNSQPKSLPIQGGRLTRRDVERLMT